jgi:hypothetical protein
LREFAQASIEGACDAAGSKAYDLWFCFTVADESYMVAVHSVFLSKKPMRMALAKPQQFHPRIHWSDGFDSAFFQRLNDIWQAIANGSITKRYEWNNASLSPRPNRSRLFTERECDLFLGLQDAVARSVVFAPYVFD